MLKIHWKLYIGNLSVANKDHFDGYSAVEGSDAFVIVYVLEMVYNLLCAALIFTFRGHCCIMCPPIYSLY